MFEGGLYSTSLQSLTLAIWGAYRTLDGPGFKPLISKTSECDPFEGEETPEGIFCLIQKRRRVASLVRESSAGGGRRGPIRAVQCGARLFRRQPQVDEAAWAAADGWDSATVAPCPPVTMPQLLWRARMGDSAVVGPSH